MTLLRWLQRLWWRITAPLDPETDEEYWARQAEHGSTNPPYPEGYYSRPWSDPASDPMGDLRHAADQAKARAVVDHMEWDERAMRYRPR